MNEARDVRLIPLCRCPECGSVSNTERFCALHAGGRMVKREDYDLGAVLRERDRAIERVFHALPRKQQDILRAALTPSDTEDK